LLTPPMGFGPAAFFRASSGMVPGNAPAYRSRFGARQATVFTLTTFGTVVPESNHHVAAVVVGRDTGRESTGRPSGRPPRDGPEWDFQGVGVDHLIIFDECGHDLHGGSAPLRYSWNSQRSVQVSMANSAPCKSPMLQGKACGARHFLVVAGAHGLRRPSILLGPPLRLLSINCQRDDRAQEDRDCEGDHSYAIAFLLAEIGNWLP